jgi:hypothetical protein
MRSKDITKVVNRQIANVNAAIPKIKEGINAVTVSPGVAAANNIEVLVQNFLAKYQSGELEASLRGIDLGAWKASSLAGTTRIGPGMERKRAVIEEFHRQLQEYQMSYTQAIDQMPSGTLETSRARMNANFDAMAGFKFRK